MKFRFFTILPVLCILLSSAALAPAASERFQDTVALEGITRSKTLFDINLHDASKLELYLNVIQQTREDLLRQQVNPEIIIAFRGASVRLITTERWSFTEEDQQSLERSGRLLSTLLDAGVRIEACSIATNLFKVDNDTLLPGINVVGNTFVSLTGYQTKGYALIPIQ
ncbi:DsrE family protein [Desulfopila sp. IMCC35008]|uniref:DsrE family protein n=1 Tax=Desulfopila sp. IMCC35008 TaxID=2653858 RepID=UPI0013CF7858|nr:DsrE family protein [Desulfopila sp. IMCC35008]